MCMTLSHLEGTYNLTIAQGFKYRDEEKINFRKPTIKLPASKWKNIKKFYFKIANIKLRR